MGALSPVITCWPLPPYTWWYMGDHGCIVFAETLWAVFLPTQPFGAPDSSFLHVSSHPFPVRVAHALWAGQAMSFCTMHHVCIFGPGSQTHFAGFCTYIWLSIVIVVIVSGFDFAVQLIQFGFPVFAAVGHFCATQNVFIPQWRWPSEDASKRNPSGATPFATEPCNCFFCSRSTLTFAGSLQVPHCSIFRLCRDWLLHLLFLVKEYNKNNIKWLVNLREASKNLERWWWENGWYPSARRLCYF